MDLGLSGRLAVITGGSRGIGLAVATKLAREGADIAIIGRNRFAAEEACTALCKQTGRRAIAFQADTGDDLQVERAVEAIASEFGRIDILVNNASLPGGGGGFHPLSQTDTHAILTDINVKVMGYLRTAKHAAPHMTAREWGRIINIGGIAAYQTGSTEGSIRCAAVGALTKNLADELGPHGITVNAIHPGPTRTERSAEVVQNLAKTQNKTTEEIERHFSSNSILGRFVTPQEIASLVAFLASANANVINGEAIEASGGSKGSIRY